MKKLLLALLLVSLTGCNAQTNDSPSISPTTTPVATSSIEEIESSPSSGFNEVFIKDETFVAQMDEIFTDIDEYVGKTIHFEGLVTPVAENTLDLEFAVTRYYDVSHEDHMHTISVGLNCSYEGSWPKEGSWVEIVGTIETEDVEGTTYPIVRVTTLTPKETRGQEKVTA